MSDLILKSGGVLWKRYPNEDAYDEDGKLIGEPFFWVDVSENMQDHLHRSLVVESVTVGEIYQMVEKNETLYSLFKYNFVESFIEYLNGIKIAPFKKKWENSLKKNSGIEQIEILRMAEFNPITQSLTFGNYWSVSGKGVKLTRGYNGFKKGEQISWSLSMSPVENYYYTPVVFNPIVYAKAAMDSTPNTRNLRRMGGAVFERDEITLFELIHAVTWEFSFYGTPKNTKKESDKLREANDEVAEILSKRKSDAEIVELLEKSKIMSAEDETASEVGLVVDEDVDVPAKNSFEELMGDFDIRYNYGFENIKIEPEVLNDFIGALPREINLGKLVDRFFKDVATLKPEYRNDSVYEYCKRRFDEDGTGEDAKIHPEVLKAIKEGKALIAIETYPEDFKKALGSLGYHYSLTKVKTIIKELV